MKQTEKQWYLLAESARMVSTILNLYKEFTTLPLTDRQLNDDLCRGLMLAYQKEADLQDQLDIDYHGIVYEKNYKEV